MSQSYNPAILDKECKGLFMKAFMTAPASYVDRIATVEQSDTDEESYAWMGDAPAMYENHDYLSVRH